MCVRVYPGFQGSGSGAGDSWGKGGKGGEGGPGGVKGGQAWD